MATPKRTANPSATTTTTRKDIFCVDVLNCIGEKNRCTDLNELKESIKSKGVIMPILVKPTLDENGCEVYTIIDGHRRVMAIRELIAEGASVSNMMLARFARPKDTAEVAAYQLALNRNQQPLNESEICDIISNVMAEMNISKGKAVELLGLPRYYNQSMDMVEYPTDIREAIAENKVSSELVRDVIRKNDTKDNGFEEIRKALDTAKAEGDKKVTEKTLRKSSDSATIEKREAAAALKVLNKIAAMADGQPINFAMLHTALMNGMTLKQYFNSVAAEKAIADEFAAAE